MKNGAYLVIIVIITFLAGIIFWFFQRQAATYSGPIEKLTLSAETNLLPALVWIAEKQGYFEERGLEITIKEVDSCEVAFTSMLQTGDSDVVTVDQTPIVAQSFDRNDFAIISGLTHSDNSLKVLGRRDRGINSPSDLRGKKIGITKGDTGEYFFSLFLETIGLNLSEVETIDTKTEELSSALLDGKVDAIVAWESHLLLARKQLGDRAQVFEGGGMLRENYYFASPKSFIQSHPQAIKRFLSAIKDAEIFSKEHASEAQKIVTKRMHLDEDFVGKIWRDFSFELFLDQDILTSMEDEARWNMKQQADKKQIPDYRDFIASDGLRAVAPEAITLKENAAP